MSEPTTTCPKCLGTGDLIEAADIKPGPRPPNPPKCPDCNGTGKVPDKP